MKKMLLVFALLYSIVSFSQDEKVKNLRSESNRNIAKDPNDTIPKAWKKGGLLSVNLAQGSLSNWAAGGEDFSLAVNSLVSLYAFYKKDKQSWDNTFDFNLGYVNTTSLGMIGKPPLELSLDALPSEAAVADIVYNPLETPLLKMAKARGVRTMDGLGMLMHQAVPAFAAWFGVTPQVAPSLREELVKALPS